MTLVPTSHLHVPFSTLPTTLCKLPGLTGTKLRSYNRCSVDICNVQLSVFAAVVVNAPLCCPQHHRCSVIQTEAQIYFSMQEGAPASMLNFKRKESREHFSAPRWSGRKFERRSGPMRKDTCSHVAPGSLVLSHRRSEAHSQRTPFSGNGSTHAAPAARRAQSDTSIREPVFCLGVFRWPAFCSAAALCQLRPRCFLPPPSNLSGWMKLLLLHRGVFSHRCSRWFS